MTVLMLLAPGAFVMARHSSMPYWGFAAYGAMGVLLFLLANFNDNNFRRNTDVYMVLMPWLTMVVCGAWVGLGVAFAGRMTNK